MLKRYHAFLSYNSSAYEEVSLMYDFLTGSGFSIFLDKKCIPYGKHWQKEIEKALEFSDSILVVIGQNGMGPWQEDENYAFQLISVASTPHRSIVPVFLPGALKPNNYPPFLNRYQHFTFSSSVKDELYDLMRILPKEFYSGELERPFLQKEQDGLLSNTMKFYDESADTYFTKWKNNIPPTIYNFLSEVEKRTTKAKILDTGCGPGHHSAFMAERGHEVTGLDRSMKFIDIAKKNFGNICNFINADMRDLQGVFSDRNLFDAVWACASCLHLTKETFFSQMFQFTAILKPRGILGLSLQVGMPSAIQSDGRFFERYDEEELKSITRAHGYINLTTIIQETDQNTMDRKQLKRWCCYILASPDHKEKLALGQ